MNVAIIPARGGSKRIPNKNIKNFLGKPMLSYAIKIALSSGVFSKVIVSTDSKEIASVANEYGAETPFIRPEELSDDYTGTHNVVGHAVKWLEDSGHTLDYVCCIYATAPLIQVEDLIHGFEIIKSSEWSSVIAATNYSYPIYRSFQNLTNGGLEMIFPEHYHSRSQDLPEVFHDAGQFYWAKPKIWKDEPKGYNKNSTIVKIPNHRVQDIDTLDDWKNAEMIYKILNNKN
tara:strand:+ start:1841 stop:2533 length:693 start_codon:yes stop_codon:yes gene_type:complete